MVVDSTIFIDHLRSIDKSKTILTEIAGKNELYVSVINVYELYIGATTEQKQKDVNIILQSFKCLPMTEAIAIRSSAIYLTLKKTHQLIDIRDIFIAATCLVHQLPLKTLNKKHFTRIDGLIVL